MWDRFNHATAMIILLAAHFHDVSSVTAIVNMMSGMGDLEKVGVLYAVLLIINLIFDWLNLVTVRFYQFISSLWRRMAHGRHRQSRQESHSTTRNQEGSDD